MRDNAMITKVTTDDLLKMRGKEGLVFQGCGEPLSEWLDGINEILTQAGILRGGSAFENVMEFENRGVTNLLFPFDGVDLDMGRLAVWRIENRQIFDVMWLSDYADNYLLPQERTEKPSVREQLQKPKRAADNRKRPKRTEPKRGGEPR